MHSNESIAKPTDASPPSLAQKCLEFVAVDEEREDRLGDLEEVYRDTSGRYGIAAARRQYIKNATLCAISIIRRRIARSIIFGGRDMFRVLIWATASIFTIFCIYSIAGGEPSVYVQPFEWLIIVAVVVGSGLAGRRLGSWGPILRDLRRADALTTSNRAKALATFLSKRSGTMAGSGDMNSRAVAANEPRPVANFSHLQSILELLATSPANDLDHLMRGRISLFRDRCGQRLRIIDATISDAYAGSAIACVLGIIHTLGNLDQPLPVIGHLMAGSLCATFFGMIIARAVLSPISSKLDGLYSEEFREMEAMRASISSGITATPDLAAGANFSAEAFEILLSTGPGMGFA